MPKEPIIILSNSMVQLEGKRRQTNISGSIGKRFDQGSAGWETLLQQNKMALVKQQSCLAMEMYFHDLSLPVHTSYTRTLRLIESR